MARNILVAVSPKQQGAGCEVATKEVADGDEPQGSEDAGQKHPTLVRDPQLPSQTEIDEYNMTHLPFRSWCRHCVRGRAESSPHLWQKPKELVTPELHADYCFLGKAEKTVPIVVLRDRATQMTCSMIVRGKGIGDGYVVRRGAVGLEERSRMIRQRSFGESRSKARGRNFP